MFHSVFDTNDNTNHTDLGHHNSHLHSENNLPQTNDNYSLLELNPITGEDNEYIFLELLTDNSIHPRRAILSAVDYLFDLFNPLKGYLV